MTSRQLEHPLCLALTILALGCQQAASPPSPVVESPAPSAASPAAAEPAVEVDVAGGTSGKQPVPEAVSPAPAGAPAGAAAASVPSPFTAEQTAAARQMANDLGVVLQERADGAVIGVDTAAKRSWVDDYQMEQILAFPELESLTVEGPSITDQLAPRIAQCRQLTSLACRNTLIGDAGIAQLSGLSKLRVIDLRVSPLVTDAAMDTLAAMPELRAVRLSGVNLTDAGLESLLRLSRLSELDVRNCRGVTRAGIARLAAKDGLRTLKVGGAQIDDETLGVIAQLKGLTGLSLFTCGISDAGLPQLAQLPLANLSIYQCPNISDQGLEVLAAFDRMQRLELWDVGTEGAALARLPKPELLVSLNLSQSKIRDDQVASLVRFSNLQSLDLSQTAMTDAAVDALVKLAALKELDLTQSKVTPAGAQRLRDALPACEVRAD